MARTQDRAYNKNLPFCWHFKISILGKEAVPPRYRQLTAQKKGLKSQAYGG